MKQVITISVNGKPIEEGTILNKWFENRFNSNKNVLAAVIGGTGSGKTYSALFQLEKWYQYKFQKPFPVENICFSLEDAAKRIRYGNLSKGEFILIEEAGVLMNSLDFQNKVSKFFGAVLQSFRSKNIGIMFTLPNISMLNKTARSLLHLTMQTVSINTKTKQVVLKPFYTQTNALSGKDYHKYLQQRINGHLVKVERISCGMPSDELVKIYEEKKDTFVNKVVETMIVNGEPKGKDNEEKVNPLWEAIKVLYESGVTKQLDIAKELDVTPQVICSNIKRMIDNDYFRPDYLEKAQKIVDKRLLMPVPLNSP